MKTLLFIIFCSLIFVATYAQATALQQVQHERTLAKYYRQNSQWDSACYVYGQLTKNAKYSNPFDFLDCSYCSLKTKDKQSFTSNLGKAIEQGVDTITINRYYGHLDEGERQSLNAFINDNFNRKYEAFIKEHDTALINILKQVYARDQAQRGPIEQWLTLHPGDTNSVVMDSLLKLGRISDSLDYVVIIELLKTGRYPGYKNCGAAAALFSLALMHIDHGYQDWDYIFTTLKKEVMQGNIDPDQVASIADRHYLRRPTDPVYYYGKLKWGDKYPFYDCVNVDRLRAEIGIESLADEYARQKRRLPDCYKK